MPSVSIAGTCTGSYCTRASVAHKFVLRVISLSWDDKFIPPYRVGIHIGSGSSHTSWLLRIVVKIPELVALRVVATGDYRLVLVSVYTEEAKA